MAWTDTKCGKTIPGDTLQHCPACHETFGSTTAADRHRIGGWDRHHPGPRRCAHPTDVGLHPDPKGVWRLPAQPGWRDSSPR